MLEGIFRKKEELAEAEEALEARDSELDDQRRQAHAEWIETPYIVQEDVRGGWEIRRRNFNWLHGKAWTDNTITASFPTKEKALEGVKRLLNPETILIDRNGNPKEGEV